jgi:putative transposase
VEGFEALQKPLPGVNSSESSKSVGILYDGFGHCQLVDPLHGVTKLQDGHTLAPTTKYKNHRFPVESVSHAVWLYFRFCSDFPDVEELLFERGASVTYEAIRKWCRKFGQSYAKKLRRRRPRPGDKWHMDEVFLTIKGEHHHLWRAVDQERNVLDILVQRRRVTHAAKKFFRKLLKGLAYVPRVIVTDKLKSYAAAKREILPGVEHRQNGI